MLFYIEQGCEYTMTFGDMWEQYYVTLENNFEKAMEFISLHGLLPNYNERIERMLNATDCGWGFWIHCGIYIANTSLRNPNKIAENLKRIELAQNNLQNKKGK